MGYLKCSPRKMDEYSASISLKKLSHLIPMLLMQLRMNILHSVFPTQSNITPNSWQNESINLNHYLNRKYKQRLHIMILAILGVLMGYLMNHVCCWEPYQEK